MLNLMVVYFCISFVVEVLANAFLPKTNQKQVARRRPYKLNRFCI